MSSIVNSRRGFLKGLASLPLIGGGVALIGNPTAAAVPATDALLKRYLSWLSLEHREAYAEFERRRAEARIIEIRATGGPYFPDYPTTRERDAREGRHWYPQERGIEPAIMAARPSTRAAVVLSAVGCAWQEA